MFLKDNFGSNVEDRLMWERIKKIGKFLCKSIFFEKLITFDFFGV